MSTKKEEKPIVNRDAFEQVLLEFQEQIRKELYKAIIDTADTVDFKFRAGLTMAANIVWAKGVEPILTISEPEE